MSNLWQEMAGGSGHGNMGSGCMGHAKNALNHMKMSMKNWMFGYYID
jgi:hypothetical protein